MSAKGIDRAVKTCETDGYSVLYAGKVEYPGIIKSDRILVITDGKLILFDAKGSKVKWEMYMVRYANMTVNDNVITFVFKQPLKKGKIREDVIQIASKDAKHIVEIVLNLCQNILEPAVTEQIHESYKVDRVKPSGRGFIARFRDLMHLAKLPLDEKTRSYVADLATHGRKIVDTNQLPPELSSIFLASLSVFRGVKGIKCSFTKNFDSFSQINELLKEGSFMRYIEIEGPITPSYDTFIEHLRSCKNKKLTGIAFSRSEMGKKALKDLEMAVYESGVRSLGFHNAVREDALQTFYSSFFSDRMCKSLHILDLSDTSNLRTSYLSQLRYIQYLNLQNCELEMREIFDNLGECRRLRALNVSRNVCTKSFGGCVTPNSLETVYANDISWGEKCFASFIEMLFNRSEAGLNLSLARAEMPHEDWQCVFDVLRKTEFDRLVSLIWDGNEIHPSLFYFLEFNPNITMLSVSDCFASMVVDAMLSLANYVKAAKSLKKLYIRSSKEPGIGTNFSHVLDAIVETRNVEFLDLTGSRCGDFGLRILRNFVKKRTSLKTLVLDGMKLDDPHELVVFMEEVLQNGSRIQVSFPSSELGAHCAELEEKFRVKEHKEIKQTSTEYKKPKDGFFEKPFMIYKYYHDLEFPKWLTKSDVAELTRQTPRELKKARRQTNDASFEQPAIEQEKSVITLPDSEECMRRKEHSRIRKRRRHAGKANLSFEPQSHLKTLPQTQRNAKSLLLKAPHTTNEAKHPKKRRESPVLPTHSINESVLQPKRATERRNPAKRAESAKHNAKSLLLEESEKRTDSRLLAKQSSRAKKRAFRTLEAEPEPELKIAKKSKKPRSGKRSQSLLRARTASTKPNWDFPEFSSAFSDARDLWKDVAEEFSVYKIAK